MSVAKRTRATNIGGPIAVTAPVPAESTAERIELTLDCLRAERSERQDEFVQACKRLADGFASARGPSWVASSDEHTWRVRQAEVQLLDRVIVTLERLTK